MVARHRRGVVGRAVPRASCCRWLSPGSWTDERERDLVDRLVPLQERPDTGTVTVELTETEPGTDAGTGT